MQAGLSLVEVWLDIFASSRRVSTGGNTRGVKPLRREKQRSESLTFSAIRPVAIAAGCMFVVSACAVPAFAQQTASDGGASYISFQAPGCQSTSPQSVNNSLSVTGNCSSSSDGSSHGFVRDAEGTITVFDPPGSIATTSVGINAAGAIAGYFQDSNLLRHGFVRSPEGSFKVFDLPGVLQNVAGIDKSGTIVGTYGGNGNPTHGFVRSPQGVITSVDPPGSTSADAESIDNDGHIVGIYGTTSAVHLYIRDSSGGFTSFDHPGNPFTLLGVYRINAGTVIGAYSDQSDGHPTHAFVRSPQGAITTFDAPGSQSTGPSSINAKGAIAGNYSDANGPHGFVRSKQGTIVVFDYPGATNTGAPSINDFGVITGSYQYQNNANAVGFGYLRLPGELEPGNYAVTDNRGLYVDGGFYLYGDPTVRLWVYVAGNPSQHWKFTKVAGGFTISNHGTGQYASDIGGNLSEGGLRDVWTVTAVTGGYTLKNNRTGLFLTDPGIQEGAVTLTQTGSVWQMSAPR